MFIGRELLVIHGADVDAFCKRHGLETVESTCDSCGVIKTANLPARGRNGEVGLRSAPCPCGDTSAAPYTVLLDYDLKPMQVPFGRKR